jgi:hypothetical protein
MSALGPARSTPGKLKWCSATQQFEPAAQPSRAERKQARFVKGPLPLDWMQCAAQLPGKALQVALTIWYLAGLQKTQTVRLPSKPLDEMGVSRDAKYDALARLAGAGLVQVEQRPGQAPVVTLLNHSIQRLDD